MEEYLLSNTLLCGGGWKLLGGKNDFRKMPTSFYFSQKLVGLLAKSIDYCDQSNSCIKDLFNNFLWYLTYLKALNTVYFQRY